MNKYIIGVLVVIFLSILGFLIFKKTETKGISSLINSNMGEDFGDAPKEPFSLSIEALKKGQYPGSDMVIEETLAPGLNYQRYITSYQSEGLKIYGLLTVPNGKMPEEGWPAIIFNHGYIPPREYRTSERYAAFTDGFSRNGFVLFRPDYRGHDKSEGEAVGAYGSNAYTIDVLNALSSIKKYQGVNPDKIGMWGHSMGGFLTLRAMVVSPDLPAGRQGIKAGVIWAGVVGSYPDIIYNWRRGSSMPSPSTFPSSTGGRRRWRQALIDQFGTPEQNPTFWNSLSANSFLKDISGPLQIHHGTADTSVPIEFSEKLEIQMKEAGKEVELYTYPGNDHNLSQDFNSVMNRSVEFFNKYLKPD